MLIELASEQINTSGDEVSVSRLSVLTGIDRREVKRIYELGEGPKRSPESVVGRVITQWQHDTRFQTKSGRPRVLQSEGKQSEFCALVRAVSSDLAPYTVRYELERIGAIRQTPRGLRLVKEALVVSGDVQASVEMMASDTADMMTAIEENIAETSPLPNYHLVTEFDNIDGQSLSEVREWFLKEGNAFHRRARRFLSKHDLDLNPKRDTSKRGGIKVLFGGFSRTIPPPPS